MARFRAATQQSRKVTIPPYPHGMTTIKFNALMAEMTPEEIGEALWYVEVFERTGMSRQEADEWRRRNRPL